MSTAISTSSSLINLSESDAAHHLSIELKKGLHAHFKNPEEKTFTRNLALRSMEKVLGDFLLLLGSSPKAPKRGLTTNQFGSYMRSCIGSALKETSSLILEEFEKESEETLEYWNRICVQLEQLTLWEQTLDQLYEDIKEMGAATGSQADLVTRCEHFETHLGQLSISLRTAPRRKPFKQPTSKNSRWDQGALCRALSQPQHSV